MSDYLTIGFLLSIITLVISWMFITSRINYFLKMIVATISVGLVIYSWITLQSILGYSINDLPPDKSYIIAEYAVKSQKVEYLWVIDPKGPKGYAIPLNEDFRKKLKEEQAKAEKQGGYVQYRRPASGRDGKGHKQGNKERGKNSIGDRTDLQKTQNELGDVVVVSPLPPKN